jgi:hypothetical protein
MIALPTPTPTPIQVQLVGGSTAPIWLAPLLTGAFVLLAALIALVSLWLSDVRKLHREDRRQWDSELLVSYLAIEKSVSSLRDLLAEADFEEDAADRVATGRRLLAATSKSLTVVKRHVAVANLIAPPVVAADCRDLLYSLSSIRERAVAGTRAPHSFDDWSWTTKAHDDLLVLVALLEDSMRRALRVRRTTRKDV